MIFELMDILVKRLLSNEFNVQIAEIAKQRTIKKQWWINRQISKQRTDKNKNGLELNWIELNQQG